jgi:hypothetical protein
VNKADLGAELDIFNYSFVSMPDFTFYAFPIWQNMSELEHRGDIKQNIGCTNIIV